MLNVNRVRRQIQFSKDIDPLMEMDKDEKKFEIFLSFHRTTLLVSDLRIFLPFTINLDPYLRKVIKDDMQNSEDSTLFRPTITQNELQNRRVQNQLIRRQVSYYFFIIYKYAFIYSYTFKNIYFLKIFILSVDFKKISNFE